MPFGPALINCYVCGNVIGNIRSGVRLSGDGLEPKRRIAISRRKDLQIAPINIEGNSRICFNCNVSIDEEMQLLIENPEVLRLNVVKGNGDRTCMICGGSENVQNLPSDSRVDIFVKQNIYIPPYMRCCRDHLNDKSFLLDEFSIHLRFFNKPVVLDAKELGGLLQDLRKAAQPASAKFETISDFSDEDFKVVSSISKGDFQELLTFCDPVTLANLRYIKEKDLIMFLCKMRQGLPDEFLKVMFNYNSRQAVSRTVQCVRESLMLRFVPQNVGFGSVTRDDFITHHVTPFANALYNPEPDVRRAIVYIDGTYGYLQKSSNFRVLRQTYSVHKNTHLIKPALVVAPDGFILAVHAAHFSDYSNNDAQMILHEFRTDPTMSQWFNDGDIMIVDRGYRDAVTELGEYELTCLVPELLPRNR